MPSRARVFNSDASVAAMLHPWITPPRLITEGAFLGYDMRTGQAVFMDFQLLKKLSIIHSAVILILGFKNHGKSALVKSLALRLLALQAGINPETNLPTEARARLHDRKPEQGRGEYAPVADHMLCDTVSLAKEGSLNLFDPLMGMNELDIIEVAINVAESISGERLPRYQPLAIQVGTHKMMSSSLIEIASPEVLEAILRSLTLSDVDDYYEYANTTLTSMYDKQIEENPALMQQLTLTLKQEHNIPEIAFREDAGLASAYFGRLLRADYGNLFGGNRSLRGLMTAPMTNIDWTGVTGKPAELLEAMMFKWQKIALERNDKELIPHLNVADEEHSALKNLMHARFRDEYVRKARAYETTDIQLTQYLTDLTRVGEDKSELRDLGQSINKGVGVRFFGRQSSDDDTLQETTRLGVSDEDAYFTTQLPVGCWGIQIPDQKIRWVQHTLLPAEWPLIDTNKANKTVTNRVAVSSLDHIQKRIESLGSITIGVE